MGSSTKVCCLCGEAIDAHLHPETGEVYWTDGHNAMPIRDGRCCSECNGDRVLPARLRLFDADAAGLVNPDGTLKEELAREYISPR